MQRLRRILMEFINKGHSVPFPIQPIRDVLHESIFDSEDIQDKQLQLALLDLESDPILFNDSNIFFQTHLNLDLKSIIKNIRTLSCQT